MSYQAEQIENSMRLSSQIRQSNRAGGTDAAGFQRALKQAYGVQETNLDSLFQEAAERYGVSAALLKAVGKAESGFNPNAVSKCGAQGIMQLMPKTAASLGVSNAFDPRENIMGGASYLAQKLDQYNGDIRLALAAYNAGSGNVAKYGGVPPFPETQKYIEKVLGYMQEEPSAGQVLTGIQSGLTGGLNLMGFGGEDAFGGGDALDISELIRLFIINKKTETGREIGSLPDSDESYV